VRQIDEGRMQITVDRRHFLDKVDLLKEITKTADKIFPVARNVLIELPAGKISATNLSISAMTALKCGYEGGPVKIMVQGGTLEKVLANLKSQDIEIDYPDALPSGDPRIGNMIITQGRIEIGLAIGDPDEFPQIELLTEVESLTLPASDILRGIKKVFYAVSSEETRYVLTGMLMMVKDGKLIMCGTDGFRMALWQKDLKDENDTPQIVIQRRNVRVIEDTLGEHANVGIIITPERVQMMTEAVTLIARTITGAFPDYEAVCGTDFTHMAYIKRIEMLECLNRISAVRTATDPVSLHRVEGGMQIDVKSEGMGYAREIIDAKYKSAAPLHFAFNGKYLIDALEHLEGEEITLRYPTTYGAIVFDEADYTCVIMPIRDSASPIEEAAKTVGRKDVGRKNKEEEQQVAEAPGTGGSTAPEHPAVEGSTPSPAAKKKHKVKQ
jgi:DNA polymerase-3 subunit beta